MKPLILALPFVVAACGVFHASDRAEQAGAFFVGQKYADMAACLGTSQTAEKLDDTTTLKEWGHASPATSMTIPSTNALDAIPFASALTMSGSFGLSDAGDCHLVLRVNDEGVITEDNFVGDSAGLFGPLQKCAPVTDGCFRRYMRKAA